MPMFTQKLHIAKNMEALQEMASVDIKKFSRSDTNKLCNSAKTLLLEAEKKNKENDEEMAFVYYLKFIELVLYLKKRPDFHTVSVAKFLSDSAPDAMEMATKLKASLSQRYASFSTVQEQQKIETEKNLAENSSRKSSEISETVKGDLEKPTTVETNAVLEHSISVSKLFTVVTDHKSSFLILDVRPQADFEESHMKHSACVNVPQEILEPGLTASELERKLPPTTYAKWSEKNSVDYVIILDWDTVDTNLPPTHPIHTLEKALVKWDLKNPLKKPPLILTGGYKEWLLRYPMYTTKALDVLSLEVPKQVTTIADVSDVDYPDLEAALVDEIGAATVANNKNRFFGSSGHQSQKEKVVNGWVRDGIYSNQDAKHQPLVNRLVKPNVPSSPNTIFSAGQCSVSSSDKAGHIHEEEAKSISKSKVPEFNRSLKPAWAVKSEQFTEALGKEESAVKETLTITELEFNKEKEFAQLRLRKELEAEESKRIELQKQEELLLDSIKKLQAQNLEHEQRYQAMKEENNKMKKLLEQQSNEEQKQKEKDIQRMEMKKDDLQKEVERLRQERKLKEQQQAIAKAKGGQSAEIKIESEKQLPHKEQSKEQVKYAPENEQAVPTRVMSAPAESSSRGLTRSYSSPNIAQMVAEQDLNIQKKVPTVDRSLKPKYDFFKPVVDEISSFKIRNLNPTYGQVPIRAATGLRNLGNTCYMNSTIQCLSNTEQLANYFNHGKYKQHIRRNSKQGTNGEIVEDFAIIIRSLWAGQYRSFSPKDFKNTASKYIPMCVGYEQQDSHEFLVVLMDKLHGDLNQGRDIEPLSNMDTLADSDATEKFWNHHKMKNRSEISDTFEGLLKSTLSCLSCRKTSNSYEVFSCLSLPISSTRCTLRDSLLTFLKSEKMCGEGAWDCPNCRQKKEAEKTLTFCKLPEVLIIQLKRFSYEGMWRRKIQALVEFPMRLELPPDSNRARGYSLYGIVNHFGYLEGGHYTAFCKNPNSGRWYKYDDHEVSEINQSEIVTSAAYLLFYSSLETRM